MESWELTVWEVLFFPVPEEIAYSFFNFLFYILELYKFSLWVSQLENKDLVSDYIFTSQSESHSIPDIVLLLTLNYDSGLSLQPFFHKWSVWLDLNFYRGLLTAVLAGHDTFLTENITEDRKRFITQSKHMILW